MSEKTLKVDSADTELTKFISIMKEQLGYMDDNLNRLLRLKERMISEPSCEENNEKKEPSNDIVGQLNFINLRMDDNNQKFNQLVNSLGKLI